MSLWKSGKNPACNSIPYSLFLQSDVQSVLPVSWEDNQAACLLPGCSELLQPAKKTLWDFVQNSKKLNIYLPSYNLCIMGLIWKVPRLKGQVSFQTVSQWYIIALYHVLLSRKWNTNCSDAPKEITWTVSWSSLQLCTCTFYLNLL